MSTVPRMARVVVPVHNEELLLGRCLAALDVVVAHAQDTLPGVDAAVVVVLDKCRDRSAEIASGRPGVQVLSTEDGRVGTTRALGCAAAVSDARRAGLPDDQLWLACTDADSIPPPDWLVTHLQLAREGAQLVLGVVEPDPADLTPALLAAYHAGQRPGEGHPHVHGANLGVRADAYLAAGGFPHLSVHEDVALTAAVRALGVPVRSTAQAPVLTSGRLAGRTPGGFSGYLSELAQHTGLTTTPEPRRRPSDLDALADPA